MFRQNYLNLSKCANTHTNTHTQTNTHSAVTMVTDATHLTARWSCTCQANVNIGVAVGVAVSAQLDT